MNQNMMGAQAIDPRAAEQREMQQRGANVNFAGQVILSMVHGNPGIVGTEITPDKLFAFAIGLSEQMSMYVSRPFDEPGRLVS